MGNINKLKLAIKEINFKFNVNQILNKNELKGI